MKPLTAEQWTRRVSARLMQQWPTLPPAATDEVAGDLWLDAVLRAMVPERAAVHWLQQGIPNEALLRAVGLDGTGGAQGAP